MSLIGGRIFVILLATRHVCVVIRANIEGYHTYRRITRVRHV